jgi:hypothetical protein
MIKKLNHLLIITAIVVFISNIPAAGQKISLPLSFDYYYTYDMMVEALKKLHDAYPELTKLDIVGQSEEGRNIYAMTINNKKTGGELDKPAVYVDGNIHGNEIQATEVTLYLLNYLLKNYGKNDEITKLVDSKCFYVVPVVNVDGRYHFFADPNTPNSNRGLRRPKDDDNDGLINEDFPDDLDGDGNICNMRKKDPFGQYKTDPEDSRLMVRIEPGEQGEWTNLGSEGIDNDGDGRVNEDAEGYVDPNRNWGSNWMPPFVQSGSGDYPFSGVGIKALANYIAARPNICMAWAFHNFGGMFLRGPSTKSKGELPRNDVEVYDYLGEYAERMVPGYRYLISWKDLYETYGDFTDFMSSIYGVFAFVGELHMTQFEQFTTRQEEKSKIPDQEQGGFRRRNPEVMRKRLKFNDHLAQGELYKPWTPFKHPSYGDIEIGGWTKMSDRIPETFMLKDLVHRNASVVIFSAKQTPEISMDVWEIKKVEPNLYRVRVRLVNNKAIPTMSQHAQKVNLYPKDVLTLKGKDIKVVAGGELKNIYYDEVAYKEYKPEIQFLTIPGFGKAEYQFLVTGSGQAEIEYKSRHAGRILKTITIK